MARTAVLTHYGRKTGRAYEVTIWFVSIDGRPWVGSQDRTPGWVRNVTANGNVELDTGKGPRAYRLSPETGGPDIERFERAVLAKYPLSGRLIRLLGLFSGRTAPCAFSARERN